MARTKISEFSATPGNNTDIDGINLAEGCAPSGINDAIRELMAQLKDWQSGTSGDSFTIGSPGTLTYSSGTANGVAYLNGSKVLTTGSALVFDGTNLGIGTSSPGYKLDVRGIVAGGNGTIVGGISYSTRPEIGAISNHPVGFITNNTTQMLLDTSGNLGLGVTPSAWGSVWKVLEAGRTGNAFVSRSGGGRAILTSNTIFGASSDTYANTGAAAYFDIDSNSFKWYTAPSGTAGNAISFTQAMTLDASGNLLVGGTTQYGAARLTLTAGGAYLALNSTSAGYSLVRGFDNGTERWSIGQIGFGGADGMAFYTGSSNTERARIDSSGNLLVGTTSANGLLTVVGGSTGGTSVQAGFGGVNATSFRIFHADAGGSNGAACVAKIEKVSSSGRSINAAGTVNASGADYAEYMVKAGDFSIAKGDVCGIDVNGKLTNVFADAVTFMVKSTNPSYVGGDTWGANLEDNPEGLEAARQTVDRIAFAGQVPVNVMGATPGQYIVPVSDNGAIKGIAKNEADMTLAEYMKAVGKVIAIEADGRARIIVKVA